MRKPKTVKPNLAMLALVGPTAIGKTAVGMALAKEWGGEIISADAVSVYRGLDIGAAKPSQREQSEIPFHLIDVCDPDFAFTVADFTEQGSTARVALEARGNFPLLVGGTGLYVRSLTAKLTIPEVPPQDEIRARYWAEVENLGAATLHAKLAEIDPITGGKILPGDAKRIIRALEVWEVTGKPMSHFHTPEGVHGVPLPGVRIIGLRTERATLYQRIEARVDAMMAAGFLGEVERLLARGYTGELKAMRSLGYKHLIAHLTEQVPLDVTIALIKQDTRRFAKRQITWFQNDPRVEWIDIAPDIFLLSAQEFTAPIAKKVLTIVQ